MRLLSFRTDEVTSFGALVEGRIVDLGRYLPEYDSLRDLLAANALVRALDTAAEESAAFRLDQVELLPPIPDPARVLCTFDDDAGDPIPIDPKFLRGTGRKLLVPADSTIPLAAGMALVFGRAEQENAPPPIIGLSLMTYLSPGSLAMGPCLVTMDEIDAQPAAAISVTVDDQHTELPSPDYQTIAERITASETLSAGDVLAVLSPLPVLTVQGTVKLEVASASIGSLKNTVEPAS